MYLARLEIYGIYATFLSLRALNMSSESCTSLLYDTNMQMKRRKKFLLYFIYDTTALLYADKRGQTRKLQKYVGK